MAPDGLKYAYSKIANFLKLGDLQSVHGCGVTLILTPVWMFVGIINKPYSVDPSTDVPLYHDGFAYAGILNLQTIKQVWPATAGMGYEKHKVLDAIHK
jgi:hypothetical protein